MSITVTARFCYLERLQKVKIQKQCRHNTLLTKQLLATPYMAFIHFSCKASYSNYFYQDRKNHRPIHFERSTS